MDAQLETGACSIRKLIEIQPPLNSEVETQIILKLLESHDYTLFGYFIFIKFSTKMKSEKKNYNMKSQIFDNVFYSILKPVHS